MRQTIVDTKSLLGLVQESKDLQICTLKERTDIRIRQALVAIGRETR